MNFLTKRIEESMNRYNESIDEEVIRLLKRNGYRPKPTSKYMVSLLKRMRRNGYDLTNKQDINTINSTVTITKSLTFSTTIYLVNTKDNYVVDSTDIRLNERLI